MATRRPKKARSAQVYHSPTARLFVRPSLFDGLARLWDFTGANLTRYNVNIVPAEADRRAVLADFNAVYGDFVAASQLYDRQMRAIA